MAKNQARSTLKPLFFSTGQELFSEHVNSVIEEMNYLYTVMPQFGSASPGIPLGPDDDPALPIYFRDPGDGSVEVLIWQVHIPAELGDGNLKLGVECFMDTGEEGTVRLLLDTVEVCSLDFTDAENGEEQIVQGPATAGAHTLTLEMELTNGAAGNSYLVTHAVSGVQITSSLPDPEDE